MVGRILAENDTSNWTVDYWLAAVWSSEEDVDLFYQIAQFYQNKEYYKKFTK